MAWTASWMTVYHWAYFYGHYLFLHEDKYYMRNTNNKITQKPTNKNKNMLIFLLKKISNINVQFVNHVLFKPLRYIIVCSARFTYRPGRLRARASQS